jgi:periplasmic mercuric ion binding protein
MMLPRWTMLLGLGFVLAVAGTGRAETKVELKGVHLCCGACVNGAKGILKKEGVKGYVSQKDKTITIEAGDDKAAQKAVDALAEAGFHGESGNKAVTIKDDSGAEKGNVKSLTVSGAHNCCGACCKAIKATVKGVKGVTGDTATPKAASFTVTGDFDGAELVKALNDAGFHVKVKK